MYNLLRGTCMFCHRFKMSRTVVRTFWSTHFFKPFLSLFLKLWKYLAKLRLLERGLLDAAQGVDAMQLRTQRNKDSEEEFSRESPQAFIARINLYVAIHLARTPNNTHSYKDTLVYQTRKDLINEFLKSCILKKCQNSDCGW